MAVIRHHIEPLPEQEPADLNLNPARPLRKHRRHEEFDPLDLRRLILRQVLALQVGVDRHLDVAASANRRDEVQRRAATPRADQINRRGRKIDFHRFDLIARTFPGQ